MVVPVHSPLISKSWLLAIDVIRCSSVRSQGARVSGTVRRIKACMTESWFFER